MYISYSDGKYAYDALANYNNYELQPYDLTVQVRIENEKKYLKLIEEELMDCLTSLDYCKNNIRKNSIIQEDIKVIEYVLSKNKINFFPILNFFLVFYLMIQIKTTNQMVSYLILTCQVNYTRMCPL